ncbi:hypothetical protein NA56DRAFT_649122 [Hyaloscypha hepaticicola]|uniref:Mid2 domain-containing protein n=1 Tax=Hyaloscypha hepaticicola TaxID=2082293 RepID=A0A2J6PSA4_9HELO|nr:hypothetical protein NA56DRAFT_649122 [Hyaloscypha hepaticicola]
MSTVTFTTGYTNLGSLGPTSFPSECLQSLWLFHTSLYNDRFFYLTQGCAASSCCPSGNVYTESYAYMTSYYSLGVCPSQYRNCPPPPSPTTLLSNPTETIAFCCPTNYDCPQNTARGTNPPYFLFCQSPMTFSTTTYFDVDNVFDQKTTATGTTVNLIYPTGIFVLALPIQIRMPVTETAVASFSSSSPDITSTTGANVAPLSTSTSKIGPTTSNSNSSNPSLSAGAIAGIAIGAFVGGAFVLAVFGFFLYRSIIRRLNTINGGSRVSQPDLASKPELDGQGAVPRSTPFVVPELEASHIRV